MTDVAELKRLIEAATPGPWRVGGTGIFPSIMCSQGFAISATGMSKRNLSECRANAAFIVAARHAVPDLLAENARLREAITTALEQLNHPGHLPDPPGKNTIAMGLRAALTGDQP